jgi:hypothetical protein
MIIEQVNPHFNESRIYEKLDRNRVCDTKGEAEKRLRELLIKELSEEK